MWSVLQISSQGSPLALCAGYDVLTGYDGRIGKRIHQLQPSLEQSSSNRDFVGRGLANFL